MAMIRGGERWRGRNGSVAVFPFGGTWFIYVNEIGKETQVLRFNSQYVAVHKWDEIIQDLSKGRAKTTYGGRIRVVLKWNNRWIERTKDTIDALLKDQERYRSGEEVEKGLRDRFRMTAADELERNRQWLDNVYSFAEKVERKARELGY